MAAGAGAADILNQRVFFYVAFCKAAEVVDQNHIDLDVNALVELVYDRDTSLSR